MIWAVIVFFPVLAGPGCDRVPETIYVPGGPLQEEVEISVSTRTVTTGEKIVLHAARSYDGEWQAVKRNTLSDGDCWMTHPPPAREDEVADNIHWTVTPQGHASFNVQPRADHTRTVTFSEPGEYILKARTTTWCDVSSNVRPSEIVIQVK